MSIVSFKAIRDTAVTKLATAFSPIKGCVSQGFQGEFDEEAIKLLAQRTPALMTALMRIRDGDDQSSQNLDFVTWVIVRADNKDRLFDKMLVLLSLLLPTLRSLDAPWSHGGAVQIDAKNGYSASMGQINVCLWAVKWTWPLQAAQLAPPAGGEDIPGEGGILQPDELELFAGADGDTLPD